MHRRTVSFLGYRRFERFQGSHSRGIYTEFNMMMEDQRFGIGQG